MSRVQRRDSMLQQDQSLEDRLAAVEQILRTGAQLRDADLYGLHGNMWLTGGGTLNFPTPGASYNFSWSARFILISAGAGGPGMPSNAGSGYVNIDMPANGVVITGAGGQINKTVAGGLIPLAAWDALYYILPSDGSTASNPANFRIVNYTAPIQIPANWVRIAFVNGDEGRIYVTGHGALDYWRPLSLAANWAPLTGAYTPQYRKTSEGFVIMDGLASNTVAVAVGVDTVFATLPVGYRPVPGGRNVWYSAQASGILAGSYGPYAAQPNGPLGPVSCYVDTSGQIHVYGVGFSVGGWISLNGVVIYAG